VLTEGRSVFALVRSLADLERASRELAGLLSALNRRGTPETATRLLGLWVDEQGGVELPGVLELGESADAARPARIVEATGVSGIWMLYFLEMPPHSVSRAQLLGALLRSAIDGREDPAPGHFIPVFASDTQAGCVKAEMQALERRYPGLVLAPRYQDSRTGELDLLSEPCSPTAPPARRAELH